MKRPDFPFFKCSTAAPLLVFKQTPHLSIGFSGSHWTSSCSPKSVVHMFLYTWYPLIYVSREISIVRMIGSSSCKTIVLMIFSAIFR